MTYNPSGAEALTIRGGKFGLPVTRTGMTFDNDLNWEGLYQQVRGSNGPMTYRFVAAEVPIAEASRDDDALMFAGFGEVGFAFGDYNVQFSVGNYAFREVGDVPLTVEN